MHWISLKRGKIKVYGKQGKLLPRGMAEEHTAFLHNLLSNDIRGMKENTFTYNLWLKQNGFPVGEFYVYKLTDHYLLDTSLDVGYVIEEFNRLKLSMRVYFEALEMEHIFLFGEGVREFIRERFGVELGDFEVKLLDGMLLARNPLRLREEGYEIMGQVSELPLDAKDRISEEEYEDIRIQRLVPKLGKELREGFSPLEACLLREAISLTKGCYVGQEAIARVYYRGRLPRALALFEGEGLTEGEKIRADNKDIGIITSVSPKSGLALGYLLIAKAEEGKDLETNQGKRVRVLKLCEEGKE